MPKKYQAKPIARPRLMTLAQNRRDFIRACKAWTENTVDMTPLKVRRVTVKPGEHMYVAHYAGQYVGMLLVSDEYAGSVSTCSIDHVFVIEWARRKGIARAMHDRMMRDYRIATTPNGSDTGGEKLLRAIGYEYDETRGGWRYVRPTTKGSA